MATAVPDEPVVTAEPAAVTEEPRDLTNEELATRYGDSVFKVESEGCQVAGWGTAWVLDEGHLVTNWHVVNNDPSPELVSRDGRTRLEGTVIGGQAEPDVAVIRVEKPLPEALPWADTGDLREGQDLVAIGYPVPGGDFSVTPSTVLSFQMDRGVRMAVRGDGALDRGNSGGPALTRDGEVAGVVTQMADGSDGFQMVPLMFTADALRGSVERILASPQEVEPECEPAFAQLPDDWAPDFEDWFTETPSAYGDDPALDGLYDACAAGDLEACDELWWISPYGSDYEAIASSCGGMTSDPAFGSCVSPAEWGVRRLSGRPRSSASRSRPSRCSQHSSAAAREETCRPATTSVGRPTTDRPSGTSPRTAAATMRTAGVPASTALSKRRSCRGSSRRARAETCRPATTSTGTRRAARRRARWPTTAEDAIRVTAACVSTVTRIPEGRDLPAVRGGQPCVDVLATSSGVETSDSW